MIGIDLFSGAGGMSLGAIQAGIFVNSAIDYDTHALATYNTNHRNVSVLCEDIRSVSATSLRNQLPPHKEIVIFGGPPCQGFSYSNVRTRHKNNPDNWLFLSFLRIVQGINPEWIVLENVRGIVDTAKGLFLSEILSRLDDIGYTLTYGIYNAQHYGVPQDRARFFLVGSRDRVKFRMPRRLVDLRLPFAMP